VVGAELADGGQAGAIGQPARRDGGHQRLGQALVEEGRRSSDPVEMRHLWILRLRCRRRTMPVMHSSPFDLAPQALATSRSAAHTLRRLGQAGLFRLSLPSEHGGLDAPVGDLAVALAQLRAAHPAAARLALAQLGAIQALLLGDNVALREFRLPALVAGERAAVLAGGPSAPRWKGCPARRSGASAACCPAWPTSRAMASA
jgi:alkylation response protein AidB-like acyl-CoA dehydrogenase